MLRIIIFFLSKKVWCDVLFFIFLNSIRDKTFFKGESYADFEECSSIVEGVKCDHRLGTNRIINKIIEQSQIGRFVSIFLKYKRIMYSIYPMYFVIKRSNWMAYSFELYRAVEYDSGFFKSPDIEYPFNNVYLQYPKFDRLMEIKSL